jgi:hypothetical protein
MREEEVDTEHKCYVTVSIRDLLDSISEVPGGTPASAV